MQYDKEKQLHEIIPQFYDDPLGFVQFIFPWNEGALANCKGPDTWQEEILNLLATGSQDGKNATKIAISSGHGVGKTAMTSWIVLWFMSTRVNPQIIVTANTKTQLETKTWRELAKWQSLALNGHWFTHTASKFFKNTDAKTWFAASIAWSKERSEAFAGAHEENILIIYDEASAIDDIIWEVTEGAMTTPGAFWLCFGNPTRNSGKFHSCFHRQKHRWHVAQVDSRTAHMANQQQIKEWIEDYGEDSDFVRIRVRGVFPRGGSLQFISSEIIQNAFGKHLDISQYCHAEKVIGVDVARFGDDQSVLCKRHGLACFALKKWRNIDTMTLSSLVAQEATIFQPDCIFVDGVGIGAGVVDRLRQLGFNVVDVQAGATASNKQLYANKRAEMWTNMRSWLEAGAALPHDTELEAELSSIEYGFTPTGAYLLEKKQDMKRRGLSSPDCADSLALTFAAPVQKRQSLQAGIALDTGRKLR